MFSHENRVAWLKSRTLALRALLLLLFAGSAIAAQVCDVADGYVIELESRQGSIPEQENCSPYSIYSHCYEAEFGGAYYEVLPAGCDPSAETCSVKAILPIDFPGLSQNDFEPCCTPAQVF